MESKVLSCLTCPNGWVYSVEYREDAQNNSGIGDHLANDYFLYDEFVDKRVSAKYRNEPFSKWKPENVSGSKLSESKHSSHYNRKAVSSASDNVDLLLDRFRSRINFFSHKYRQTEDLYHQMQGHHVLLYRRTIIPAETQKILALTWTCKRGLRISERRQQHSRRRLHLAKHSYLRSAALTFMKMRFMFVHLRTWVQHREGLRTEKQMATVQNFSGRGFGKIKIIKKVLILTMVKMLCWAQKIEVCWLMTRKRAAIKHRRTDRL